MPDDIRAHWYEFGNPRSDRRASVRSIHYMIKNALLYCKRREGVLWADPVTREETDCPSARRYS